MHMLSYAPSWWVVKRKSDRGPLSSLHVKSAIDFLSSCLEVSSNSALRILSRRVERYILYTVYIYSIYISLAALGMMHREARQEEKHNLSIPFRPPREPLVVDY